MKILYVTIFLITSTIFEVPWENFHNSLPQSCFTQCFTQCAFLGDMADFIKDLEWGMFFSGLVVCMCLVMFRKGIKYVHAALKIKRIYIF